MSLFHNIGHLIDLILQHNVIPCLKKANGLIYLCPFNVLIRPAVEDNTVISCLISLYNGISRADGIKPSDKFRPDSSLAEKLYEKFSVLSDCSRMVHLGPRSP